MQKRPLWKKVWYDALRLWCRLFFSAVCRLRCQGREHIPATGGVLVVSNHQSQLDPIVVGLVFDRRLNYLARKTLFRFPPFRWLIESLDAIPIDREGTGLGGLKETLRRLKNDELVLIFPEGTRTTTGDVLPMKPGFTTVASRAKVPILPVAIDGPYQSLPRGTVIPRPVPMQVQIGEPILPDEIARLEERDLAREVERRVRECHARARALRDGRMHPWSVNGLAD